MIDGIISGASDLMLSDGSSSTGDVTTDIGRIIDGTGDLLDSPMTVDGSDLYATIDSIIASTVPPLPTVDVKA